MTASVIYVLAGIGFAWALPATRWQRALTVPLWLPLIAYGMIVDAADWWQSHGYRYDDEEPATSEDNLE